MSQLSDLCKTFQASRPHDRVSVTRPVRWWTEKDCLDSEVVDAFVVIFVTPGCSWAHHSGCTMCGYGNDSAAGPVTDENIEKQIQAALKDYHGEPLVKIFNSGSFLDDCELSKKSREAILTAFSKASKIAVESRPEYITAEALEQIHKSIDPRVFEIGIGLETANDFVREHAINKGFSFEQYKAAALLLKKQRMSVKTYLLSKPPFLTEQEAGEDNIESIRAIAPLTNVVSLNPVTIQRHTLVEFLWRRDEYRPPWLWTLVEVLRQGHQLFPGHLKCDTVGGGSQRGPHNCGECDKKILDAISAFSLHQDPSVFDDLACPCKELWQDQWDHEQLTFGSVVDWSRWKA